jgi:hypothetical protein
MLPAIDDADIDVTVLTGKGRRAGLQIHQTTRLLVHTFVIFAAFP